MKSRHYSRILTLSMLLMLILSACGAQGSAPQAAGSTPTPITVHLGYFPNITHAVALVGVARGTFKQDFGANTLDTRQFNAGPALIEALLAGDIDIGYVGPNPAINGYIKSHGEALRIIAGAASGGALFILRPGANIKSAKDLSGKKLATPQKGGTQDISLRHYLQQNGLKSDDQGGSVQIIPTDNANILNEFKQGQIDGAWVPEPWASRLVLEAKGSVFIDERSLWPDGKFVTTNVVVRKAFLDQHPDVVKEFLQAHIDSVQYLNEHTEDAKTLVNAQLQTLTGKALSKEVLDLAFKNLDITYDPLASTLYAAGNSAFALGFVDGKPDKKIYDLTIINAILSDKKLAKVSA